MQLFKIHGKNTFESEVRLFHADNYVDSCSRTTSKLLNHQFSKMKREKQREAERRRKTNSIHIHDLRWNVFWICCSCFFSVILLCAKLSLRTAMIYRFRKWHFTSCIQYYSAIKIKMPEHKWETFRRISATK